jgi:hypothetical protein
VSRRARLADVRAQSLLRWYPQAWRSRYGEEFAELLAADLTERPRSSRRTAALVVNALLARLSLSGLGNGPIVSPQAALAAVGAAMVVFGVCGLSLWSQLLVGWRWSAPDSHAVTIGLVGLSVVVTTLCVFAVFAASPVVAAVVSATRQRGTRRLIAPLVLVLVGVIVLVGGGDHFAAAWPGSGGDHTSFERLLPHGVAGFAWAETVGITAFWAHPSDLLALPTGQLAWTVVSPIAYLTTVGGAVNLVRRADLSSDILAYEARLAKVVLVGMMPCLAAAAWWVVSSHAGSNPVFRAGSLDVLLIATMSGALAVISTAGRRLGDGCVVREPGWGS